MPSLAATEPVDYAVLGAAGAAALAGLAACLYTVPWRLCRAAAPPSAPKATRSFNVLWHGRALLALLLTAWALSPLLRVSRLWGANSFVFSDGVTSWTGSGWMCRIYLTAALGVLQPLCAFLALLMLTAGLSRRHRPEALRHPNARLLGLAALCTLPVAAVQVVVAWLSLAVQYQGQPLEQAPRSVLGYFFATYWEGSPEQCGTQAAAAAAVVPAAANDAAALQTPGGSGSLSLSAAGSPGDAAAAGAAVAPDGGCTLCCFPAAAVAVHAIFTVAFLAALWVTCSRLADAVLNSRLKRRMRLFQLAHSLLAVGGVAALGVSIVQGPFTWLNQACWAAYVGTAVATVALVLWEVVVSPVRDLRSVDKRLALWADATTAAFAAAGADEPPMSTQSSGGSSVLIKAHNRSAEAEAYVQAAAAARTLSASPAQGQEKGQPAPPRPSLQLAPLALPPLPQGTPRRSPAKQPTPLWRQQAQPSPLRQQYGTAPSPLVSPPRQVYPTALPLPVSPLPAASPHQSQQQQQQLYPSPSPQFVQRQQLVAGPAASLPPQQLFP